LATASARAEPDFLVIGAQRSGTSSLFRALSEHPQVVPPALKELHHFDHDHPWPHFAYRCYFPRRDAIEQRSKEAGAPVLTGEGTPNYLFHVDAPARIARALPDARFVVVLREPVARAWSHYRMLRSRGWLEDTSLRDAVVTGSDKHVQARRPGDHWRRPYGRYAIYERGLYAEQLERWFSCVPRERLFITRYEDLYGDDHEAFDDICRFIGIEAGFRPTGTHLNEGPKRDLPTDDAAWLAERYEEPNRRLDNLVGISW
jgi:hypothetical protein